MNKQEKKWFKELQDRRATLAAAFDEPSAPILEQLLTEIYSSKTHFIYELLQNAEDARASFVQFILEEGRLIFTHNGSKRFSISAPDIDSERRGFSTGHIGHINAITSLGGSSKKESGDTIGRFGIGFKSVFRYTSTPHIYDKKFRFKIERYVVPQLLEKDFPGRKPEETVFVFPFNHPEQSASTAYGDISWRLENLSFPLLFCRNIEHIKIKFGDTEGEYKKEVERTLNYEDCTAELVIMEQNERGKVEKERLWLFSCIDESGYYKRSVGFLLDEEGQLRPAPNIPAFCFFPTKESTGLNFIIHAPFFVNVNREGIVADEQRNQDMIEQLAALAANAILCLKDIGEKEARRIVDDQIIDIIPCEQDKLNGSEDKISFLPFYNSILELFKRKEIVPTRDGYTTADNAYWASAPKLTELFSDQQLGEICGNEDAHWVFVSRGREATHGARLKYIDSIVKTYVDDEAIIEGRSETYRDFNQKLRTRVGINAITAQFIEEQSFSWLHEFYAWLHGSTKKRTEAARKRHVFLNQNRKAVAAVDATGEAILFLPSKEIDENEAGCNFVHRSLLKNKKTREYFIEELGVKEASLRDYIHNVIVPQYRNGESVDTAKHFKLFFSYYCECSPREAEWLVGEIENLEFLIFKMKGKRYRAPAGTMYLPKKELQDWFETRPSTRFLALDEYKKMVGKGKEDQLLRFLGELGVQTEISILIEEGGQLEQQAKADILADYWEAKGVSREESQSSGDEERDELNRHRFFEGRWRHEWKEGRLDGCKEIVEHIVTNGDVKKSLLLWNTLIAFIKSKDSSPMEWLGREHKWMHRVWNTKKGYYSSDARRLRRSAWLLNRDGEFLPPAKLTKSSLADGYDISSTAARILLDFLGVQDEDNVLNDLPDDMRALYEFAKKLKAMGADATDLDEFREFKERKARKKAAAQSRKERHSGDGAEPEEDGDDDAELDEVVRGAAEDVDVLPEGAGTGGAAPSAKRPRRKLDDGEASALKSIARRVKETPQKTEELSGMVEEEDDDADQDVYTPRAVDYEQRIRREESRGAANVQRIVRLSELQKRAKAAKKYSFARFMALLDMECLNSEEQDGSKEISISFAKVEREPEAQRTLVLTHPNRYIPPAVEELDYFPLMLYMAGGEEKKLIVEAASVKSSDKLHIKLKSASDIGKIDFSSVQEATISVKSPAFLIKALRERFEELGLEDDFDMRASLCENIEFVFGPPGTGKTTHLARNVLLPLMQGGADCKVLVLAPTNKAADVLAHRIMEVAGDADSCSQWLVRFGTTPDEKSGLASVYKDRAFDILTQRRSVVVTTVARFAYDGFTQANGKPYLRNIEWDYIVIDEASMIPIANIIYPLYKQKPQKFIIAGDPFQIEPITSAALWKDENIYTMVGLNTEDSFKNPQTGPHSYKVERLETQYRSIPEIGQVFSNFAYNGILQHNRTTSSQRPLNIGGGIKALNIIKFPVSRWEGIYRAKRLQGGSPYQIYAALFTYEYVLHLAREIAKHNPESSFKIGVIAPYRAQADLIDRLLASATLPKEVQVQAGTIHGFQGDECDIIFAVFNTPPTISTAKGMFLNKRNIINVAISRARDYLFIVMPDDETEGIENLKLVKRVESLAKHTDASAEFATQELEVEMFGEHEHLKNNIFFTSHQNVNVYSLPVQRYEVRAEDSAVDIQIHHQAQRAAE